MFEQKYKVSFYDCDPAGILFFANLFKFAHYAYENLIESFNLDVGYFESDKFIVPITHTEGNYYIPMKSRDRVKIEVTASQIRNSSFELTYKFYNESDKLSADVKTVHVFVNKKDFTKMKIPTIIEKKLKFIFEK